MKFYSKQKDHLIRTTINGNHTQIRFIDGEYETSDKAQIALLGANQYVTTEKCKVPAKALTKMELITRNGILKKEIETLLEKLTVLSKSFEDKIKELEKTIGLKDAEILKLKEVKSEK